MLCYDDFQWSIYKYMAAVMVAVYVTSVPYEG